MVTGINNDLPGNKEPDSKSIQFKLKAIFAKNSPFNEVLKALGLVFGDIGTSPLYTLTAIFLLTKPTPDNILGCLSLIVWALIILVSTQYAWLAMGLGQKGEGGTVVLREILVHYLKSGRNIAFVTLLTFIGVSLLIGDGVITPAVSILSAVEGSLLIPGMEHTRQEILILAAGIIAIVLFTFQRKGTEKVSGAFGPLMVLWFSTLAISGIVSLFHAPFVIKAVIPYYAIKFFFENGLAAFFVLSEVILCATGGEALYADMGHLGRTPIRRAWYFVFAALALNYLGQGAFLFQHPDAKNIFFEMFFSQSHFLYIPFLILSIIATVIASQAMISGMFSIVFQGITTNIMPLFKVDYTSTRLRSQIYIGTVNWFLLLAVLFVMFLFKASANLTAAYGLAVTGTMSITGIMLTWIFYLRKEKIKSLIALFVTFIDIAFLLANMYKIPHGGYWSIIIAALPLAMILIYTKGNKALYKALKPKKLENFLDKYNKLCKTTTKIKGTALFLARDIQNIPPYIVRTMFTNNIIYEDNILFSIIRRDTPFGVKSSFREDLANGLRRFEIEVGYMEIVDVEKILKEAHIYEKSVFYGLEDISTENLIWKIYSIMKKLSPTFVQFYKIPSHKLHGVVTRLEM